MAIDEYILNKHLREEVKQAQNKIETYEPEYNTDFIDWYDLGIQECLPD